LTSSLVVVPVNLEDLEYNRKSVFHLRHRHRKNREPPKHHKPRLPALPDPRAAGKAMTVHLNRPPGAEAYLQRQLANNIPDSPTQGLIPHLDPHMLAHQIHPDAVEYPHDSEAYDVISKSPMREGKPRTIEGYIRGMNRYGRRIHHRKWMLRKFRV
jgi:hypothetical protein